MRLNATELADFYGVDPKTVTNWLNEKPACPSRKVSGRRVFDSVAVAEWHRERLTRQIKKAEPANLDTLRAEKVQEEIRLLRIEAAKLEGALLPEEVVDRVVGELADRMRAILVNVPGSHSLTLERAGVAATVAQQVLEQIAEELTTALRSTVEDWDDGGDRAAA